MATDHRMERTRTELSEFLRSRRERLDPGDIGLPSSGRRRKPGLRREEVAALSGVGLTWYTWLEQGREISVSADFLENVSRVLKLDAAERRYLFLLTQRRPPVEPGKTWCVVPGPVHRLMGDLVKRPAYVINLRWDVLAWNPAADLLFNFSLIEPTQRNFLWMIFMDRKFRSLFDPWKEQAQQMVSQFRRDFVRATQEPDITALVNSLEKADPDFGRWWKEQEIPCSYNGSMHLSVKSVGRIEFERTMLTIDEDRHLRLNFFAATEGADTSQRFEEWVSGHGPGVNSKKILPRRSTGALIEN